LSQQLGTTDEQWQALYGLGRLARSAHRDEVAYTHFRDAISEIESVRAQLQLETSLKTDFLADKRDVYDALLEILLERGMPRRFSKCWNERGRGRSRIAWRWHSRRSPRSSRGSRREPSFSNTG